MSVTITGRQLWRKAIKDDDFHHLVWGLEKVLRPVFNQIPGILRDLMPQPTTTRTLIKARLKVLDLLVTEGLNKELDKYLESIPDTQAELALECLIQKIEIRISQLEGILKTKDVYKPVQDFLPPLDPATVVSFEVSTVSIASLLQAYPLTIIDIC